MSGRPSRWSSRALLGVAAVAILSVVASACGAIHPQRASRPPRLLAGSGLAATSTSAVLSLAGLGTFEGRCPRGASSWTLRFVVTAEATDTLSYAIGTAARRTVNVQPGQAVAVHLVANASRTRERADRFVPPIGQGRGVVTAVSVPTTTPLHAVIYQATEPQTLQADVDLALSTIGGESGQCILVGSTVEAFTYPNGPRAEGPSPP